MKNLFKKIFGMSDKSVQSIEELYESVGKYSYQWVKGDNIGKVNHFKEIVKVGEQNYVVFTDESRISLDLLEEFTDKVEKGFYEAAFDPAAANTGPVQGQYQDITKPTVGHREVHTVRDAETPIAALLKKQKENWVDVDLNLTINLPKKSLWDVMLASFENAEDEIIDYVTKDLDIEVVREALKKSIKDIYSSTKSTSKNVRPQNTISEQSD